MWVGFKKELNLSWSYKGLKFISRIKPTTVIFFVLRSKRIFYGLVCKGPKKGHFRDRRHFSSINNDHEKFKLHLKWFAVTKRNMHNSQWDSPDWLSQCSRQCRWTNAWVPLQLHGDSNLKLWNGFKTYNLSLSPYHEFYQAQKSWN